MAATAIADSNVLIIGGTSGIGLETAIQFARAGAPKVALIGRDPERGELARRKVEAAKPGVSVVFVAADATNPSEVERLVFEITRLFGHIDVLVNSAGHDRTAILFHEIPLEEIPSIVRSGLNTTLLTCRIIIPLMYARGSGVIVNVASDAAKIATPGETVIGAALAGIVMFSKALALEAKRSGVRVNCITPSLVEGTRSYDQIFAQPFSARLFNKAASRASLGVVTPKDIAPLIVFIASPDAARMTGQAISVNGGISAG